MICVSRSTDHTACIVMQKNHSDIINGDNGDEIAQYSWASRGKLTPVAYDTINRTKACGNDFGRHTLRKVNSSWRPESAKCGSLARSDHISGIKNGVVPPTRMSSCHSCSIAGTGVSARSSAARCSSLSGRQSQRPGKYMVAWRSCGRIDFGLPNTHKVLCMSLIIDR